jgi:hypothetical protein
VSDSQNLLGTGSATKNVAWKIDVPGRGWSCLILWGDRVFITSVVSHGKDSEAGMGAHHRGKWGESGGRN